MSAMFKYCENLRTLNLSNFKANKVSVYRMFQNCESLESLDLSNFEFENIDGNGKRSMFYECTSLKILKLPNGYKIEKYIKEPDIQIIIKKKNNDDDAKKSENQGVDNLNANKGKGVDNPENIRLNNENILNSVRDNNGTGKEKENEQNQEDIKLIGKKTNSDVINESNNIINKTDIQILDDKENEDEEEENHKKTKKGKKKVQGKSGNKEKKKDGCYNCGC